MRDICMHRRLPQSMQSMGKGLRVPPPGQFSWQLWKDTAIPTFFQDRTFQLRCFHCRCSSYSKMLQCKPNLTCTSVVILYFKTSRVTPTFITHLAKFLPLFPFIYFWVSFVLISVSLIRWLNPYLASTVITALLHNLINSMVF